MGEPGYRPLAPAPPSGWPVAGEVEVPAGPFVMGTDDEAWAYDNEGPAHVVDLAAFRIDAAPVTNAQYAEFIAAGGYDGRRWWTEEGWAWREKAGLKAPEFWRAEGGGRWSRLRFGWREDLPLDEPVQHVCWYEADAYARWAGKRLPTEAEWEKAARGADGRVFAWGDKFDPTFCKMKESRPGLPQPEPVGAFPMDESVYGVRDLTGGMRTWTADVHGLVSAEEALAGPEEAAGPRVNRGGAWNIPMLRCRTAARFRNFANDRYVNNGFRLVKPL
jgi:iron(II)-dependent oxidoreductase